MRKEKLLVALLLATASCAPSPNPTSGVQLCGPGESCASGYHCAFDKRCWKIGDTPPGGLGGTDGGATLGAGASASADVPTSTGGITGGGGNTSNGLDAWGVGGSTMVDAPTSTGGRVGSGGDTSSGLDR